MAQMTATPVATRAFLLDGKWIEEGDQVEIRSPYDDSVVGRVFQGRREHAEAAIAAAVKAFGTTRRLPAFERQRVLRRVAENLTQRKEEFAHTLAQESGKPIKAARSEVGRSIFTFSVAAEESTRIYGEYLPLDWQEFTAGRWGIVRRFPLGPIAGIMICDYYLVRRRQLAVEDLYRRGGAYEFWRGFNPRALVALVLGIAVALIGLAVPAVRWLYDYAWFVGFVVSGGWYFLLMPKLIPVLK